VQVTTAHCCEHERVDVGCAVFGQQFPLLVGTPVGKRLIHRGVVEFCGQPAAIAVWIVTVASITYGRVRRRSDR
jgi:Na+/glutamate symporter